MTARPRHTHWLARRLARYQQPYEQRHRERHHEQSRTQVALLVALIAITLTSAGCGLAQAVSDGTTSVAKRLFTTQIKTLSLDLVARASLNPDAAGQSLSTVVRLYQLKDDKTFQQLTYAQLERDDLDALNVDLLARRDLLLRPGAAQSVNEPALEHTRFIGVAAFFRDPGNGSVWKLILPIQQWKTTRPVKIEARGNVLELANASGH